MSSLYFNMFASGIIFRAEGDGEQPVGGEEELRLPDPRPAETDRGAGYSGEGGAGGAPENHQTTRRSQPVTP